MSKASIIEELQSTFQKHKRFFDLVGLTDTVYYKWIHGFKTYDQLRQANRFVHGCGKTTTHKCLLFRILSVKMVYDQKKETDEVWDRLFKMAPNDKDVRDVKVAIREAKRKWSDRPKPPRGNE